MLHTSLNCIPGCSHHARADHCLPLSPCARGRSTPAGSPAAIPAALASHSPKPPYCCWESMNTLGRARRGVRGRWGALESARVPFGGARASSPAAPAGRPAGLVCQTRSPRTYAHSLTLLLFAVLPPRRATRGQLHEAAATMARSQLALAALMGALLACSAGKLRAPTIERAWGTRPLQLPVGEVCMSGRRRRRALPHTPASTGASSCSSCPRPPAHHFHARVLHTHACMPMHVCMRTHAHRSSATHVHRHSARALFPLCSLLLSPPASHQYRARPAPAAPLPQPPRAPSPSPPTTARPRR